MTATEKQLLVSLKSNNLPDVAKDDKGFFIIWADGRGQVGYKNKKHAIDFIELGDRDAISIQYRERKKGETVRNFFSADKSASTPVHHLLFKEAEDKKEYRKKIAIHEVLFSQIEDHEKILEEDERLEKEGMSQQSGGSNLKNSGWNTNWRFEDPSSDIERVKKQVSEKAFHFFSSLRGQGPFSALSTSDLRPNALSFLFHYFRTIIPEQNEESAGKARNAMAVLEGMLPGFQQFQQDIEGSNIPLNPYFMVSKFSSSDGGVDEANLTQFISQEQGKQLSLPDGTEVPSASHYREHVGRRVNRTDYIDKVQTFSMDEVNTATARMLKYAIADRVKDGYILKDRRMGEADTGTNLEDSIRNMYEKRLADNNIDINNPAQQQQGAIYLYHYGKMSKNIEEWQSDPSSVDLTSFELRIVLQNMAPMHGSQPKTPPDKFRASVMTLYAANGWDSTLNNPNIKMLTLPPLRQLPRGEVVYDRGNGNMGYDHLVLNWKQGLSQLLQKWGTKCSEWLSALQGGEGIQEITQQSPEIGAAWKNVISLQSGNRTGAETLLNLFKDYPTWNEFNKNHVQKSLASEIRSVNKLRQNRVTSQNFRGGSLSQQIQAYVQQILQTGQSDPKSAHAQLTNLSSELVQYYMQGADIEHGQAMDWKKLTLALHALNTPVASAGMRYQNEEGKMQRVSNGLTAHPGNRANTAIDEQGFGMLQQYGYQVAKMMDFLSAIMYRSSHEQVNTPYGPEHRFGHQYSTSSGTSQGGGIILTVDYSQLEATASSDPEIRADGGGIKVDVNEQLTFSLGQKSGVNDEPILLRSSLPWEQMVEAFNEMYPEAGYQFAVVNEPISRDLDLLEQKIKEALNDARGEAKVIYHNSQGNSFVLSGLEIADEEMSIKEDAGETDLTDATQEVVAIPAQPTPIPETGESWSWSMGTEAFEPTPSATEVEEQVLPPSPAQPTQFTVPQQPKQEMPKAKPMTDPMNLPISDPSARYIQKKDTKGRRLLRQNAELGSIEERLQKAANKLDECSEFAVADKIDLLLQTIHEGKDVRETSRV